MKKQSSNLFATMSKATVENLTQEVKETLAIGIETSHRRSFSRLDLWNIHRQRRTIGQRRQFA